MAPTPVTFLILAPTPAPGAGALELLLDQARMAIAGWHREGLEAMGLTEAVVERGARDDAPFGAHLLRLIGRIRPRGLILMGGGAMPLATNRDRREFLDAAAGTHGALANNAWSGDVVAVASATEVLGDLPPDLPNDNALPRWLKEVAGVPVRDLRARRRLAVDIDSPLDVLLLAGVRGTRSLPGPAGAEAAPVVDRLAALRALARDPTAELLVAGRISATDLRWLETGTRSRTRALAEERGMRTAALGATQGHPNRRPPRSVLGTLLDRDGPEALGHLVAGFSDGALVDSRVLVAQRFGPDERAWPHPEDRYASDLLLPDRVRDPWLRALTASALAAPVPVLLGGHTLVGPGARLALAAGGRA